MFKPTLENLIALCKRRGFVFASAEIYGGLNGVYDFGPLGFALKENIKKLWFKTMKQSGQNIVFIDGAILGHEKVWQASGHATNFSDPMTDCLTCKHRYRTDDENFSFEKPCKHCGAKTWTEERKFQLMFETALGAVAGSSSKAYLRPETAQSIFINFKNVCSSTRVKIPFGIGQIGKAFRNEITPKQFLFRMREFEQMEMEFFCAPDESDHFFSYWIEKRLEFYQATGLQADRIRIRPHEQNELAHYSKVCSDVEYEFPFGWKELEGIAHRSNYDLTQHTNHSGKDLSYFDASKNISYLPHVIETSVGVDRLFLTILFDAYQEDIMDEEKRIFLKIAPCLAPIQCAVLPLTNKQSDGALQLYQEILQSIPSTHYDESGSIGKRYRRQDEIGTPFCITYDYQTSEDQAVTVRNRDTGAQERINLTALIPFLKNALKYP